MKKIFIYIVPFLLLTISCFEQNRRYEEFDKKQHMIIHGMRFKDVNKLLGSPKFILNRDSIFIAQYDYGNPQGYYFTIFYTHDSLAYWKDYEQ